MSKVLMIFCHDVAIHTCTHTHTHIYIYIIYIYIYIYIIMYYSGTFQKELRSRSVFRIIEISKRWVTVGNFLSEFFKDFFPFYCCIP